MSHNPAKQPRVNQLVDGFLFNKIIPLPNLRATAIEFTHLSSGAHLLHIHNDDPENLFSISIPTPPPDNTGLPHILEHMVLAGSDKYPLKEPFFEMIKMSMATFINAMTGADCTYYPVASNVKQDLFNLADVYFDAVFYPLLSKYTFQREAHRLVLADKEDLNGGLTINGIVYNEMKGAFSDPETRLWQITSRGLFPDTIYSLESGGEPASIPQLTYQALTDFHSHYYHPSNACFFFYGNIPTLDYIDFLKQRLIAFTKKSIDIEIRPQARWHQPRKLVESYPLARSQNVCRKTYLMLAWAVGDATDPLNTLLIHILGLILFGNEAAPLKKALIDSGLGSDIIFSGDNEMGHENIFSIGLKGSEPGHCNDFEQFVLNKLDELATAKLETTTVLAALQQTSYIYLEIQAMHPLHVMDHALRPWIYNKDPLLFLQMQDQLATVYKKFEQDPYLFNHLIRTHLLDNQHRLTVTLKPDLEQQDREEQAFTNKMETIRTQLSDKQMQQLIKDDEQIEQLNNIANSADQLAKLPQLTIDNLPSKLNHIPTTIEQINGVNILRNDVFCNGINYLAINFNLGDLSPELWPIIPRYCEIIDQLGTIEASYEDIAKQKAATTGGIECQPIISTTGSDRPQRCWGLRFNLKALDNQFESALDILHNLLFKINPHNRKRLQDVLRQTFANYQTDIAYQGSYTAVYHAGRGLNPENYLLEMLNGLPQLYTVKTLNQAFDQHFDTLVLQIESLRDFIVTHALPSISFTGSSKAYSAVCAALPNWFEKAPVKCPIKNSLGFKPYKSPPREGLVAPIEVAHCAMVMPAVHFSDPDEALLTVGTHLVNHDYILNEVRLKGGAYGAWLKYHPLGRTMQLGSFNDPHIVKTLQVFRSILQFIQQTNWTDKEVDRAIIATAKYEMWPIRPATATNEALQRHLYALTPQVREAHFARLKNATAKEIKRALSTALEQNLVKAAICVVSNHTKLKNANKKLTDQQALTIEEILQ